MIDRNRPLRRHLVDASRMQAEIPLREALLRTRRYGEPDQGVPTGSLCRSHLDRHDAGKPAAPMVGIARLHSALRRAPDRAASYGILQRELRHNPSQAAQDWRSCSCQRPAHQICHGLELSGGCCVGPRCHPSQRSRQRARLARVTRGAASVRTAVSSPGPPRDQIVRCTRSTGKVPAPARVFRRHERARSGNANQLVAQTLGSCKDSVRNPG